MGIDIKGILSKIGLGAAAAGATAANVATDGLLTPLTSTLLKALTDKLDPSAKAQVEAAVTAAQAELQQAEYAHTEKIATIVAQDIENARSREQTVRDRIPATLALSLTFCFFLLLALMIFHPVPTDNQRLLDVLFGALGAAETAVVGYYFGSSAGSFAKTQIIGKIAAENKEQP